MPLLILLLFLYLLPGYPVAGQVTDTPFNSHHHNGKDTDTGAALMKISKSHFSGGNYELASKAALAALSVYEASGNLEAQFDVLERLTTIAIKSTDSLTTRNYLKRMTEIAGKTKSVKYSNAVQFYEGKLYYQFGDFKIADSLAQHAFREALKMKDSSLAARSAVLMANIDLKQGAYKDAGENYFYALGIAESLNDSITMSVCYTNLGTINPMLNDCNQAIVFHKKALILCQSTGNFTGLADAYATLGDSYSCANKPDSSIASYKHAILFFKQLNNIDKLSIAYGNLGSAYQIIHQQDSAIHYLELAKQTIMLSQDSSSWGNITWSYGNVLFEKFKKEGEKKYLDRALQEFNQAAYFGEKFELSTLKIFVYKSLSEVYSILNKPEKELYYLKLYNTYNDSVLSSNYTSQLAEMQTKFETAKKENEITRLNLEKISDHEKLERQKILSFSIVTIAALIIVSGGYIYRNVQKKRAAEKQVAILEKQNAIETMRSKIAYDVHDDMGANLTKLGLNAQQLLLTPDLSEKERVLAEKISLQSKEVLAGMKEIIWSSNPANDNLKSMLGFMRQYIDRFFDGTSIRPVINFPHEIGEITLHPEVRRNLFLILKESLNNALKYSDADKINIDFNHNDNNFNMKIKDFGKGMDNNRKDDFSNGLNNMQNRARKINALLNLISSPGNGVLIEIQGKLY